MAASLPTAGGQADGAREAAKASQKVEVKKAEAGAAPKSATAAPALPTAKASKYFDGVAR